MKTYNPANTLKVAAAALTALAAKNRGNYTHEFYKVEVDLEMANVQISSPDSTVEVALTEDNAAWNIADKYISDSPTEAGKKAAQLLH